MIALLVTFTLAAAPVRGGGLLPITLGKETILVLGKDTLHTRSVATTGACTETSHRFEEWGQAETKVFPGDTLYSSKPRIIVADFVDIGWKSWSTWAPGITCKPWVTQPAGGVRFRYVKSQDWLVFIDTVSYQGGAEITNVQARWQYATYDPKQRWVKWADSLVFAYGMGGGWPAKPVITLTDSMTIDSITPATPEQYSHVILNLDAVDGAGNRWYYDYRYDIQTPTRRSGFGVKFPAGTTLRALNMVIWRPTAEFRPLRIWSGGKVIDSIWIQSNMIGDGVDRNRPLAASVLGTRSYDIFGRQLPSISPLGIGEHLFRDSHGTKILFEK